MLHFLNSNVIIVLGEGVEDMAEFKDRLLEAIKSSNLKQADIVERTGINKGSLSSYLSGKYKPKQDNTYRLAKILNVNEGWLMGFDVEMERPTPIYIDQEDNYVLSDQEKILIDKFRKIEDNDRYIVIGFIDGLLTAETSKNKNAV